ncbi:Organic radical activating enzyme [Persephonella hydrogeniphila]|uniref:7-carboxy-7-deazaguanine synthase n=1 Tax=Persephonella hydrogeniphila TaxID=198703 RepID=A0A285NKR4_9AQUI|nr:7-carboxy-7-deazaguanine synthase QueE [Persephonella hydrogeniphila]SNZ09523.1 Organic radical activating enzyme [Persephonella hydrogeniphila]
MTSIKIVEIFRTVEGEGKWVGLPVSFIRLEGCNLRCPWCDTSYSYDGKTFEEISIDSVIKEIEKLGLKRVCITGGEPFLTPQLPELVKKLINRGYKVLIETNGTLWIKELEDIKSKDLYITCSPKPPAYFIHPELLPFITELKYVVDEYLKIEDIINEKTLRIIKNDFVVLQPESNRPEMVRKALKLQEEILKTGYESRIIPQCHKILGLP